MGVVIQIPIFPLPDVVLFPHTLLPLHIFEPRYRRMVEDVLAGDRRLAMAILRSGWEGEYYGRPPVHPVAGVGEVIQHERLPDGRFNILLRGTMRIGIMEELSDNKPYRVVRARPLPDRYPAEGLEAFGGRLERLKVFYLRLLAEVQKGHEEIARIFSGVKDPGIIVDRIAAAAIADTDARRQALELLEVDARLQLVQDHLVGVQSYLSDRNAAADRAPEREH
ncbi:MAG: LON peptidase substrate-binding domain-containing protein [Candidatus Methylomirabilota bacterium]